MHQSTESGLNYLTIGGYNPAVVKNPENIVWIQSFCTQHWEINLESITFSDTIIDQDLSGKGIRARISIEERGIIIRQKHWSKISKILQYKNNEIRCIEGHKKSRDAQSMRSYCYYKGSCNSPGLKSLKLTLLKE